MWTSPTSGSTTKKRGVNTASRFAFRVNRKEDMDNCRMVYLFWYGHHTDSIAQHASCSIMKKDPTIYVDDMLEAITLVEQYVTGINEVEFSRANELPILKAQLLALRKAINT